jgi:hypothetical protein
MKRTGPTASLWLLGGAAAPVLFIFAVVAGGMITPGFSHVAGPVSALIMPAAPAANVLIPLFALYNVLLIGFAFALPDAFRASGVRLSLFAPVALVLTGVAGAAMLYYPMDPLGVPTTRSGRFHVYLAGIASLGSMIAIWTVARSLSRNGDWLTFARYSRVSLAVVAVSGLWAATAAAERSPLMGLAERVTIGAFLQWLFVLAVALLRRPAPADPTPLA